MGLSSELSCEAGRVSPAAATPTGFYSQRFWGFISPRWNPGLCSLSCFAVVPPGLSACSCGTAWSGSCCLACPSLPAPASPTWSSSRCLAACPLHPGCPSPPLLLVWMNVSSLTLWLSGFHTVQFSGSSGSFLFLNLLLSFFSLCEEAQCVYLCFHIGQKFLLLMLTVITWLTWCLWSFSTVKVLFLLFFHTVYFGSKSVIMHRSRLRNGELCSPSLRARIHTNYLDFCTGHLPSLPIHSFTCLFI